jgi:hypothetical protein
MVHLGKHQERQIIAHSEDGFYGLNLLVQISELENRAEPIDWIFYKRK